MGVPLGHKLKILKRIKDTRAEKGMSVPVSRASNRPAAKPKEAISYGEGISVKPVSQNVYEELPMDEST